VRLDVDRWLAQLPVADERESADIVLEGCLIASDNDKVRLLVGRLCLAFARADVLAAEELDDRECGESTAAAIHARLVVRRGAALLDASPGELHADRIRGRAPFALSARPPVILAAPAPRYRALERAFMAPEHVRSDERR
jgi:hypothetical protein